MEPTVLENGKELQPIGDLEAAVKKAHDIYMKGNIANLEKSEQTLYVKGLCSSLGLNPLTNPIEFLNLNRKLVPYVKKDGTDQLRKIYNVSITKLEEREVNGCLVVKAYAMLPNGRTDSSTGAVSIGNLRGDALCNAIMKAETKAKRRATLSICGLGFLDESETETIPNAKKHDLTEEEPKKEAPTKVECVVKDVGDNRLVFNKIMKMTQGNVDEATILANKIKYKRKGNYTRQKINEFLNELNDIENS